MKSHSIPRFSLLLLIPVTLVLALIFAGISIVKPEAPEPEIISEVLNSQIEWNLYPSPEPFSHSFRVDWPHNQTEVSVYDLSGTLIPVAISITRAQSNWEYEIGSNLQPGLYILQLKTGNEVGYAKLSKTI